MGGDVSADSAAWLFALLRDWRLGSAATELVEVVVVGSAVWMSASVGRTRSRPGLSMSEGIVVKIVPFAYPSETLLGVPYNRVRSFP